METETQARRRDVFGGTQTITRRQQQNAPPVLSKTETGLLGCMTDTQERQMSPDAEGCLWSTVEHAYN